MSAFEIYFLDVGQGDCSLIRPPEGNPILMDCGSAHVAQRVLNELGIKDLEAVIVSHLDKDHIVGISKFMQAFIQDGGTIEKVFIDIDRHGKDLTEEGITLIQACLNWNDEQLLELVPPRRGSGSALVVTKASEWSVEIVSPSQSQHLKRVLLPSNHPNALSAVIRIQCFGKSILIGADAPLSSWEDIENEFIMADVVRVPHHGADFADKRKRWSSMSEFYQEVSPTLAIVSVGTRNGHGHPTKAHVHALPGACRKVCTQLTKQCHDNPAELRAQALKNIRTKAEVLPYRHQENGNEVPCAGSIMVRISPDGNIETFPPANDWHDDFITRVPRALCRA